MSSEVAPPVELHVWLTLADPSDPQLELERTKNYLARAPSDFVSNRDDELVRQAIRDTYDLRVQTAPACQGVDGGEIVGQTFIYDRRAGRVHELGSVKVEEGHGGWRLQQIMGRSAIVHLVQNGVNLVGEPDWMVYAGAAVDNGISRHNLEVIGFELAAPDHRVWTEIGKTPTEFEALKKVLYVLSKDALPAIHAEMERLARDPVLRRADGSQLHIHFGVRMTRYGDPRFYAQAA